MVGLLSFQGNVCWVQSWVLLHLHLFQIQSSHSELQSYPDLPSSGRQLQPSLLPLLETAASHAGQRGRHCLAPWLPVGSSEGLPCPRTLCINITGHSFLWPVPPPSHSYTCGSQSYCPMNSCLTVYFLGKQTWVRRKETLEASGSKLATGSEGCHRGCTVSVSPGMWWSQHHKLIKGQHVIFRDFVKSHLIRLCTHPTNWTCV